MSKRTDRNVIHAGGGDLPNVFQGDTAARFEFYAALAKRDRLTQLRRLHIVEQVHFVIGDFKTPAHLIETIGLDYNANAGPLVAQFAHSIGERADSAAAGEVIVFHQDHFR